MMIHPTLSVPFLPRQTPVSFCSQIGARLHRTTRDLCKDLGFEFQALVDGCEAALQHLRRAVGLPGDAFIDTAVRRVGERKFEINQHPFPWDALCRSHIMVCPECLDEDYDAYGDDAALYGRVEWILARFRECPVHQRLLVSARQHDNPIYCHDFSWHVRRFRQVAGNVDRARLACSPSKLTTYLQTRLQMPGEAGIFGMPIHAVAKSAEILGLAVTHGTKKSWRDALPADLHQAGALGFEVLESGTNGVIDLLHQIKRDHGTAHLGPKAVFGRLYEFLGYDNQDSAFDPIRKILKQYLLAEFPFEAGQIVLGEPVNARLTHSIHSSSREYGIHPKTLRKCLKEEGIIPALCDRLSDNSVVFAAESNQPILQRISSALSLKQAAKYLNIPRPHERLLLEAGYLVPTRVGGQRKRSHQFAISDLNELLSVLLRQATPLTKGDDGFDDIQAAAKRANRGAMEIVELIHNGALANVRVHPERNGYQSILVDVEEIKTKTRGGYPVGLTVTETSNAIGLNRDVVNALFEHRFLPWTSAANPVNRCPTRYADPNDVDRFAARYISLMVLAKQVRKHHIVVKRALDAQGVKPVFPPDKARASFYDRAIVSMLDI